MLRWGEHRRHGAHLKHVGAERVSIFLGKVSCERWKDLWESSRLKEWQSGTANDVPTVSVTRVSASDGQLAT